MCRSYYFWSEWPASGRRPPVPHTGALPTAPHSAIHDYLNTPQSSSLRVIGYIYLVMLSWKFMNNNYASFGRRPLALIIHDGEICQTLGKMATKINLAKERLKTLSKIRDYCINAESAIEKECCNHCGYSWNAWF